MRRIALISILLLILVNVGFSDQKSDPVPVWSPEYRTTYSTPYNSKYIKPENLKGVQCPIPKKDRVPNYTGIQCVYSSLEMLGRWAQEPKLTKPALTSRKDCKGYSSPHKAGYILRKLGVKFESSVMDRKKGIELIKRAMSEGRGALFGVTGHAMVIIHYDENTHVVKYVDNSDRKLRVQTTTTGHFKKMWNSWVIVIYADRDIIPLKVRSLPNKIPIVDRNNRQRAYPKNYIPMPIRD